jgi:ubiquinone biosynthesis protein COQ4
MMTRDVSPGRAARPSEHEPPLSTQLQPLRALRALARLAESPDDTAQVSTITEALSGASPLCNLARFRARPERRRLLAERPALLASLADRAALERLPEGSLGRAYLAFVDGEGITPDGLVQASLTGATKRGSGAGSHCWRSRSSRSGQRSASGPRP